MRRAVPRLPGELLLWARKRSFRWKCPGCGRQPTATDLCLSCLKLANIDPYQANSLGGTGQIHKILYCAEYAPVLLKGRASPLKTLLQEFKYHDDRAAGRLLARLFARAVAPLLNREYTVIPVPLSAQRLRSRGYNQAGWLANRLARRAHLPLAEAALLRKAEGTPQRLLNGPQRRRNLKSAFMATPTTAAYHSVLLVDDVITTGTTLRRCAEELRAGGAKHIDAAVLLRADLRRT